MFEMRPIGKVCSPFSKVSEIPKGPGAKHEAEGVLEIASEFDRVITANVRPVVIDLVNRAG